MPHRTGGSQKKRYLLLDLRGASDASAYAWHVRAVHLGHSNQLDVDNVLSLVERVAAQVVGL